VSRLSERIAEVLAIDPSAGAVEFEGTWWSYGQVADTVEQAAALVPEPGTEVGILLRNHPVCIGFLLGVLRADGCVVTINPGRGISRTRDDIATLDLPVVLGMPDDVAELVPEGSTAPATVASATDLAEPFAATKGTHDGGATRRGVAVRMLTSGTTGPPKRIDLGYGTLERVLVGAKHYGSTHEAGRELRGGVAVVNSPLVHLGGLFRVLTCVTDARSFAFLERFTVEGWVDAVRRHRPATASLVPAALRMVLEADLDPADLASLKSVVSGTAPLDPDDADAFRERYGVPVLVSYAATEFGGPVAGWNLPTHRERWAAKRGSVGTAAPGCALRVVDPESGAVLPPDAEGVLEVRAGQLGAGEGAPAEHGDAGWLRTTDLARIDADGFLYILGRADQAIIRGGFKVLPEVVKAALERHHAVRFAAVVAKDDRRLGAVPVAAVELKRGASARADDLLAYAGTVLARYEVPVELQVVDPLPRTESGKVDVGAVRALFGGAS
jgi:acyl-CoA synthetase (AMP-forming)/AMP-acid ligase II